MIERNVLAGAALELGGGGGGGSDTAGLAEAWLSGVGKEERTPKGAGERGRRGRGPQTKAELRTEDRRQEPWQKQTLPCTGT